MNETMSAFLNEIARRRILAKEEQSFEPLIFTANSAEDRENLTKLLSENLGIVVFDEMYDQLKELARSMNPHIEKYTAEMAAAWIEQHLGETPIAHYGNYVYYPWSQRVVHLLEEEEFIELRTNRNRNKITVEEAQILSTKKVGVIGLSVGQSVSVTMAMERGFGEIRLADFDLLELTNLNRIRTGVQNLGLSKVISVAREIKEIDPYLKVTAFIDGITEENIDAFFKEGGMLDVCVDECDGIDIKILCRQKAKEFHVPVVMESSDRGTLDVERFDLDPELPILHGYLDHLDISQVKNLESNEEKIPFLLPFTGIDTLSEKMRASMLEIGTTLTTWPQLASAATLGGGVTTNVCRRIFLGTYTDSGRYWIDMDEMIANKEAKHQEDTTEVEEYAEAVKSSVSSKRSQMTLPSENNHYTPTEKEMEEMVSCAIQAPSGGNIQPWLWEARGHELVLHHAVDESIQYLDYNHRGALIGMGCTIENAVLKCHNLGLNVKVNLFPDASNENLVAILQFYSDANVPGLESHEFDGLMEHCLSRTTNRKLAQRVPIAPEKLAILKSLAEKTDGVELTFVTEPNKLDTVGEQVGKAERMLLTHKQSHGEFMNEIRWTPEEVESTRTGVDLRSVDFKLSEVAGLKMARKWAVAKQLKQWNGGKAFEKLGRKTVQASSAVGLLTAKDYSPLEFVKSGRAVQRIWIKANEIGVCFQPMSALIFLLARVTKGNGEGLTSEMQQELEGMWETHADIFNGNISNGEAFLFRLFEAEQFGPKSLRKPLEEVFVQKTEANSTVYE
jgi:molybdopterin/thiamine biosynthesis adenylyltransferase